MVNVRNDLTGQRFGRLVVLEQAEDIVYKGGEHKAAWLCQCDCGNIKIVSGESLRRGSTKSCGCISRETGKTYDVKPKGNKYDLTGEYGIGYTSKGEEFWFDLEDYDKIKDYTWHYNNHGYLVTTKIKTNIRILLHRLVMEPIPEGMKVDHIVHPKSPENIIDNRKSNLRIVTNRQNTLNIHTHSNNKSGVSGVNRTYNGKWLARISNAPYQRITLGKFDNLEDAIKARKEAEEKYYGENRFDLFNKEELT